MEEGKYPWIVHMQTGSGGSQDKTWSCTGALLDPTHVLTAAHCIIRSKFGKAPGHDSDGNIFVLLGINNIADGHGEDAHIIANVSDYALHPTWETLDMLGSDLAVLTLTSPVQYSDKVKPICLPSNPGQNYVGKVAVASGFGADVDGFEQRNLMEINTTIITDEECSKTLYETLKKVERTPDWITEDLIKKSFKTKLCTRGSPINNNPDVTTGGRPGDSGSALNFKENGRFPI